VRAVSYTVENDANVINMSFDTQTNSQELQTAVSYANQNNIICVASAGNQGQSAPSLTVYPAEWQEYVMGVASTSYADTPSSFSNYDDAEGMVAPGAAEKFRWAPSVLNSNMTVNRSST
jgi:subtilisin family serine protease